MTSQFDLTRFYDVIIRNSLFWLGFLTQGFQIPKNYVSENYSWLTLSHWLLLFLYFQDTEKRDCVFFERFTRSFYNVYESYHSYRKPTKMYLAITKDGAVGVCNKLIPDCLFYWQLPPTEEKDN